MNAAVLLRHWHALSTIFWAAMIPLAFALGWVNDLRFVSFLSIYALFATEAGAWQASRTETRVDEATVNADHADVHSGDVTIT